MSVAGLPLLSANRLLEREDALAALHGAYSEAKSGTGRLILVAGEAGVGKTALVQAFGDVARSLRLGTVLQAGASGQGLPDNTGEVDPLEGSANQTNAVAFSHDGRRALLASADFLNNFKNFVLLLLAVFVPWSAVNLVDYYLVSKEKVDIPALYDPQGR